MATKTVTAVDNAQLDTAQKKFGTASGLFDGTSDKLTVPDDAAWSFSNGNFTIDCWIRFPSGTSTGVTYAVCGQRTDATSFWTFKVYLNGASSIIGFEAITGGTWDIVVNDTCTMTTDTWYHIAIARSGSTNDTANWHIFLDGTKLTNSLSLGSYGCTILNSTGTLNIAYNEGVTGNAFPGWIDEFRFSKGVARWTSNFTPTTTEYTTDANTDLLLHMNGADASTTFKDDSVAGISNVKTFQGVTKANTKTLQGVAIGSVKSSQGVV
jgi:hypothetical protein